MALEGVWVNGQVEVWEKVRRELRSLASRVARMGSRLILGTALGGLGC
jgi:hypothetical protein